MADTEFTPQEIIVRCFQAANNRLAVSNGSGDGRPVTDHDVQNVFNFIFDNSTNRLNVSVG